jgi:phosphohistidine phosphatase
MRTLVIMRHAKAETSAPSDLDRALTERGHAAAADAGSWLAAQGVEPDYALVSAATRTYETWEDLAVGAGWDLGLAETSEALYSAEGDTALDLIRELEDGISSLVVVGHNPTVGYLVQLLDDGDGDEEAMSQVAVGGYPTAAVTVFSYDGDWADLEEGAATLVGYHVGRG